MPRKKKLTAKLVWAYCRVSTLKEQQELSLEEQVRWAEEFARQRGARLKIFRERASAKTIIGRPVCSEMLRLLEGGEVDRPELLIATTFDRLSRDMTDTLLLARSCKKAGISLYVRDRGEVKMDSFADQAALVGQAMGGQAENEARSNRCKASWERRRREGKPTSNKVPYGLQLRAERDVEEPVTAPWVVQAFELYAAGVGTTTIARRFAEGAPPHRVQSTRVGPDGVPIIRERFHVWEYNKIIKLLTQPRYRGTIVPEELFDTVQRLKAAKPRWRNDRIREYPFSGAVKCAGCGRSFHGFASGGTKIAGAERRYRRTRYYACTVCDYMINAESLEQLVLACIEKARLGKLEALKWASEQKPRENPRATEDERKKLRALLKSGEFDRQRERAWQLALADSAVSADLPRQLKAIAAQEAAIRDRLEEIESRESAALEHQRTSARAHDLLSRFPRLYENATYEQRRELAFATVSALGGAVASRDGLQWHRMHTRTLKWARVPTGPKPRSGRQLKMA